ncbi:MAG: endonuclease/exonuclease/phosphatase family protein [Bacteroidota bacterium]
MLMTFVHGALLVAALLGVVATVLPLSKHEAWWVRLFDYPRLQVFVLGAATLGGYLGVRLLLHAPALHRAEVVLVGALALCLGYQLVLIAGYMPWASVQVKRLSDPGDGHTLSVMVANVLMPNRRHEALLRLVKRYDPDLLLLVETDAWWAEALAPLHATYPHRVARPLDNTYGLLFYSRLEMRDAQIRHLVSAHIPSVHARVQLPAGPWVEVHGLHPDPPNPAYAEETTERDAELLLVAREVAQHAAPVVVLGDFNDVAWSHTTRLFQRVSGLLDPRRGRGLFSTFHADYPFLRWPLDHIYHSDHFGLAQLEVGPRWGSDHLPVFARLVYRPAATPTSTLTPARDDLDEVADKIKRARAND